MSHPKLAFVAGRSQKAQSALEILTRIYPHVEPEEADVLVALGGDGFMLRALHRYLGLNKPVYGMNRGTVGFLMNEFRSDALYERIANAQPIELKPLKMEALCAGGERHHALAFNEVSLFRETGQAAHLRVSVDGVVRIEEMVCDGILVATSAGSTAYNMSAYGPILPLGSGVLALTAISAYRPRRWRGAILPHQATVEIEVMEPQKRPVGATADSTEIRNVLQVRVWEEKELCCTLLYDPEHNLEERILREQFAH